MYEQQSVSNARSGATPDININTGSAFAPVGTGCAEPEPESIVEVRVDWLSATLVTMSPPDVKEALAAYVPGTWRSSEVGMHGAYKRHHEGPEGARVGYDPEGKHRDEAEVLVELPGGWCDAAGPAATRDVMIMMATWGARATRVDLAGDDLGRRAEVTQVAADLRALRFKSRSTPQTETLRFFKPDHHVVVGAPSSNRQLVIYDKGAESGGARPGVRWELRERHDAARVAFDQVLTGDLAEVWRSRLASFIEFHDAEGARAPWFEALVRSPTRLPVLAPPREVTMENRIDVANALIGMFAAIECYQPGFLEGWVRDVSTDAWRLRREHAKRPGFDPFADSPSTAA